MVNNQRILNIKSFVQKYINKGWDLTKKVQFKAFTSKCAKKSLDLTKKVAGYAWDNKKISSVGAVALGSVFAFYTIKGAHPNPLFQREIKGRQLVYYQGKGPFWNKRNEMIIHDNGSVYTLVDSDGEGNLNYKDNRVNPEQRIEEYEVRDPCGVSQIVTRDSVLEGKVSPKVANAFWDANRLYNESLGDISKELNKEYEERFASVGKLFE